MKVIYAGVFLDKVSDNKLRERASLDYADAAKYCHHVTLCFKPTDLKKYDLGKKVVIMCHDVYSNGQIEAVQVELIGASSDNAHPHISMSAADSSVKPAESNNLFLTASNKTGTLDLVLTGRIGFFTPQGDVVFDMEK